MPLRHDLTHARRIFHENKGDTMSERKDLSPEFFKLGPLLESEDPIANLESPQFSKEAAELLQCIRDQLETIIKLEFVDLAIIAKILHMTRRISGGKLLCPTVHEILIRIFSENIPLSKPIDLVKRLVDMDILYSTEYFGPPPTNANHINLYGSTASLYHSEIRLTEYALALILDDRQALGHFGFQPYLSNTEFLNDWERALKPLEHFHYGIDYWHHFSQLFQYINRVKSELDRISRRLAKTSIRIPLRELIQKYNLTQNEQLVIVSHLARANQSHREERNILFLTEEMNCFISPEILSKDSRLVKEGLFVWVENRYAEKCGEYRLTDEVRNLLLGDAIQLEKRPLM